MTSYKIALLLYLTRAIMATPAIDYEKKSLKFEEYIVEHDISEVEAKKSALAGDLRAIIVPAGCQNCTKEEIRYCTGSDVISDHCCCDKRFREYLPYIPHTCYFGTELCTTIASDCNHYNRLRACCCDKYLLQKWKEKYGYNKARAAIILPSLLLFLSAVNMIV
ncbi:uncharacterized protein LOC126750469 [Anthonomus grandis grandis]|uniref:uncharacterized protein LOC126750469 n=1 Tax=Anthonomus grandis grandis TaxID=2921223 RepID=UPI002166649F|nr:uncharacterized protein LOC126750469 [Anthonomus grandis grandis]